MARRNLSHSEAFALDDWIDKRTLSHTDTYAGLARVAQAVLKFEKGLTEGNLRGAFKRLKKAIPTPPAPPAPAPSSLAQQIATLQVQMHTVADAVVKLSKKNGEAMPDELINIARPQARLFEGSPAP